MTAGRPQFPIADHLPSEARDLSLHEGVEEVLLVAALAGAHSADDDLISFTTLLVGLLASHDDAARWFQRFCDTNVDTANLLESRGIKHSDLAHLLDEAIGGGDPKESGKNMWTRSAIRWLDAAGDIARRHHAARAEPAAESISMDRPPLLEVPHLLSAFATATPPGHDKQLIDWRLDPREVGKSLHSYLVENSHDDWSSLPSAEPSPEVSESTISPEQNELPDAEGPAVPKASTTAPEMQRLARLTNDAVDPTAIDHLDVEREARAFARVAASTQTVPPLAIGVFGEWGTGKTFFMEKMRAHVEALQRTAAANSDSVFHSRVVQIRFNAWHYMETNLWASLVDHIFKEMDDWLQQKENAQDVAALFDRLSTARDLKLEAVQALIAARRRRHEAAEALESKRSALAAGRARSTSVTAQEFWDAVTATADGALAKLQPKIQTHAESLGFADAARSGRELMDALHASRDQAQRGRLLWRSLTQRLGNGKWIAAATALLLSIPLVTQYLASLLDTTDTSAITRTIAAISSGLATISGWVGVALKRGNSALRSLSQFQSELDRALEKRTSEPPHEILQSEQALALLDTEVEMAETELARAEQAVRDVRSDFQGSAKERLSRFIRGKVTDGEYAKHLGLIASIRRDFEELAEILAQVNQQVREETQFESTDSAFRERVKSLDTEDMVERGLLTPDEAISLERETEMPEGRDHYFQRIILYIDDLDRCPPEKVVEVLQACHLLLSFPLFVVVVAVDSRWISSSLLKHYNGLLVETPSSSSVAHDDARPRALLHELAATASPRDYLEKIFQVPYWVRRIRGDASSNFVRDLVTTPDPSRDDRPTHERRRNAPETQDPAPPPVAPAESTSTRNVPVEPPPAGISPPTTPQPTVPVDAAPPIDPAPRTMVLESKERELLSALAPFAGNSPRALKRFVNVYRLVRTSLDVSTFRELVAGSAASPTCHAILAQLAIVNGVPHLAEEFFELARTNNGFDKLVLQIEKSSSGNPAPNDWRMVLGALEPGWDACTRGECTPSELLDRFVELAPLARRYSFRSHL